MSFLQVSVFSGHQLGDYFLNQVASTKMLVTMAPKWSQLGGLEKTKLALGVYIKRVSVQWDSTIT